jgi:hypothetical protein
MYHISIISTIELNSKYWKSLMEVLWWRKIWAVCKWSVSTLPKKMDSSAQRVQFPALSLTVMTKVLLFQLIPLINLRNELSHHHLARAL